MIRFLIALSAAFALSPAWACSCMSLPETGFVHADLKRLPANARGTLFLTQNEKLQPSAFLIVSDAQPGPLKAQLSWPDLGVKGKPQRYLARVEPVGGFKPGAHYTIRYMNSKEQWRYPAQTDFFIDAEPIKLDGANHQLVLDGAPARELLQLETNSGMCSSQQPAVVQNFHYELPAAYQQYKSAIYYRSDFNGDPVPHYFGALCGDRAFGATALGGTREIVYNRCETPKGRVSIQGWAGLLEVEDHARPTNILNTDLGAAQGQSCTAFGILKEALATHDRQRISNAACHISGAEYAGRNSGLPDDSPTAAEMLDFARNSAATPRACVLAAMTTVLTHMPEPAEQLGQGLGQIIGSDLASTDVAKVDTALIELTQSVGYISMNGWREKNEAQQIQAMLEPTLPALVKLLMSSHTMPRIAPSPEHPAPMMSLGELIGHAGDKANRYIPELLAAAESSPAISDDAIIALSMIAPNDPRVQALQRTIKPLTLDSTQP
ncbi:hypothetical protein GTP46_07510 [Duganella sp. FT135W]|uniref:Uncharacterized protein n=1 Tax=Duganella flavida TaxID=2692175 RepID=A0A6L8K4S1_9BURK|nr:hypothetical protein [Duganella flavida]MYM22489.1 hypothetical protein [Duganella flavida]